jgi:hypothetical protein
VNSLEIESNGAGAPLWSSGNGKEVRRAQVGERVIYATTGAVGLGQRLGATIKAVHDNNKLKGIA